MNQYLANLAEKPLFDKAMFIKEVSRTNPHVSNATIYRLLKNLLEQGEIVRIGRNAYVVSDGKRMYYDHEYSQQAQKLALYIMSQHPLLDFRIFETVQLNEFLIHQIGRNVIFLSVEGNLGDFLFAELREQNGNNVLLNPTTEIFHQYWKEDMIVIEKLPTESPKDEKVFWRTGIEKFLVDIWTDRLLRASFSESEYPNMYESAFSEYVIDESKLFRYAKRRTADQEIYNFINNHTSVKLRTR